MDIAGDEAEDNDSSVAEEIQEIFCGDDDNEQATSAWRK